MVEKHSRDDLIKASKAQVRTLDCIKDGWRPLTAQVLGGLSSLQEVLLSTAPSPGGGSASVWPGSKGSSWQRS